MSHDKFCFAVVVVVRVVPLRGSIPLVFIADIVPFVVCFVLFGLVLCYVLAGRACGRHTVACLNRVQLLSGFPTTEDVDAKIRRCMSIGDQKLVEGRVQRLENLVSMMQTEGYAGTPSSKRAVRKRATPTSKGQSTRNQDTTKKGGGEKGGEETELPEGMWSRVRQLVEEKVDMPSVTSLLETKADARLVDSVRTRCGCTLEVLLVAGYGLLFFFGCFVCLFRFRRSMRACVCACFMWLLEFHMCCWVAAPCDRLTTRSTVWNACCSSSQTPYPLSSPPPQTPRCTAPSSPGE